MIEPHQRFQPNTGHIAASIIDGETVIVDLSNGNYYSMDGIGTDVWTMIENKRSLEEMTESLSTFKNADRKRVAEDLHALIEEMLREEVIEVVPVPGPANPSRPFVITAESYNTPVFHVYRDMRDLLALDPPMPGLRDIPWKTPEKEA
jgi:coenzyme PQQ synthesis protein D (PqqD)